MAFDNLYSP